MKGGVILKWNRFMNVVNKEEDNYKKKGILSTLVLLEKTSQSKEWIGQN